VVKPALIAIDFDGTITDDRNLGGFPGWLAVRKMLLES